MKSDRIEEQGERLCEELELERERAGGVRQWRCSRAMRERVVSYAAACSADGEAHQRIAARLGLDQATLSRWIREAAAAPKGEFRHVAIVPAEHKQCSTAASSLRLLTPHGYIVEGLELEHIAALLRVLG